MTTTRRATTGDANGKSRSGALDHPQPNRAARTLGRDHRDPHGRCIRSADLATRCWEKHVTLNQPTGEASCVAAGCTAGRHAASRFARAPVRRPSRRLTGRSSPKTARPQIGTATGLARELELARPTGLEPVTAGLEIRCSIQLSYGRPCECDPSKSHPPKSTQKRPPPTPIQDRTRPSRQLFG